MALSTITGIGEPIGAALVFSVLWFLRSQDTSIAPEDWNWSKFGATILVGIGVGLSMAAIGEPLSQETFATRMTSYTGTIVFVQGIIQAAYRNLPENTRNRLFTTTLDPPHDTHDRDPTVSPPTKLNHSYDHFQGTEWPSNSADDENDEPLNEHDEYVGENPPAQQSETE